MCTILKLHQILYFQNEDKNKQINNRLCNSNFYLTKNYQNKNQDKILKSHKFSSISVTYFIDFA